MKADPAGYVPYQPRSNVFSEFGAGEESRTLDLNLGKVALYQLSYSRFVFHSAALLSQQAGIIEILFRTSRMTRNISYKVPAFSLINGQARRR